MLQEGCRGLSGKGIVTRPGPFAHVTGNSVPAVVGSRVPHVFRLSDEAVVDQPHVVVGVATLEDFVAYAALYGAARDAVLRVAERHDLPHFYFLHTD